jgi:hypothetical protein
MMKSALAILAILVIVGLALLYRAGLGIGVEPGTAGTPEAAAVDAALLAKRTRAIRSSALDAGVARPKQILFGDLHVHSTFSFDAFTMSLPMAGGDGAHPIADACDYARHCSALDFWSINDHGLTLTPDRWSQTIDSIRQCNDVAGSTSNPDLVTYLGWEWTQVGTRPDNHYGHKNVILRDLEDGEIPTHPVTAGIPEGMDGFDAVTPSPLVLGFLSLLERDTGGPEFVRYLIDTGAPPLCDPETPVGELPADCRDAASTPARLFDRLDEWGSESLVIPHGTTWGFYTPPGSAWDKQLTSEMHDPKRQRLVEVFSGHGNSEEYRPFREVALAADGARSCPEPSAGYLPSCWRAGEIIEARCLDDGESAEECADRAATARQHFVDADFNGGYVTVPGTTVAEWQDAGQCRDCFQPAFNYRPKSSVQYIMALARNVGGDPFRFRFGFMASSDNHSARPGTGYKEVARTEFTEQRFGNFLDTPIGEVSEEEPASRSRALVRSSGDVPFAYFETERQASFFLNGGLVAVHAPNRDRDSIWDAMQRREVYGTSGPRILLWFDLLNAPGGRPVSMGSEARMSETPIFQVRAVGSFEQNPGCDDDSTAALSPERLARLCQGECYNPSDQRRTIDRIEVVRIRPQTSPGEDVKALIEDPWKVLPCQPDAAGCQVAFADDEYANSGRDALYYVRAIETRSLAVAADPLGCTYDGSGRCVEVNPCFGRPDEDECLGITEERAWSSPIFVDQAPAS